MALSHCKTFVELREILLKDRPDELLAISSKGTVPVLQLHNNVVLDESLDIMIWILEKHDSIWIKFNIDEQKSMIHENDNDFKYYLDHYKYSERYPDCSKDQYNEQCKKYLINYEKKLNNHSFLLNDEMQLVDVAIFPFIRQYANVDKEDFILTFPNLNNYLNKFCESNLFISVMNKYSVWNKNSEPLIINF